MEKNKDIGKQLFNLQRYSIIQTKLNESTSGLIPDYYAYAWYHKVYPVLDSGELHEDMEEYFKVTKEQINIVLGYADSEWLKKKFYNFYEYEDHFDVRSGNSYGIDRSGLIDIFRYIYLHNGFDDKFWDKLLEPMRHPSEASGITMEFKADYLYLV